MLAFFIATLLTATPSPIPQIPPEPVAAPVVVQGASIPSGAPAVGSSLGGVAFAATYRSVSDSTSATYEADQYRVPQISDPCNHRLFCGPLHLLPRDGGERRAFIVNMLLALVDGVVTRNGLREQRTDLYYLPTRSTSGFSPTVPPGWTPMAPPGFHLNPRLHNLREIDPLVAPFTHDGLASIVMGSLGWAAVQGTLTRHWSPRSRTTLNYIEAATHVAGMETWLRDDARYRECASDAINGIRLYDATPLGEQFALAVPPGTPASCAQYTAAHFGALPPLSCSF